MRLYSAPPTITPCSSHYYPSLITQLHVLLNIVAIATLTATANAPNTPAKGSTMPLSWPYLVEEDNLAQYDKTYQKLFTTLIPAALNGRLTAKPSGKFWIPIPMARFLIRDTNVLCCHGNRIIPGTLQCCQWGFAYCTEPYAYSQTL